MMAMSLSFVIFALVVVLLVVIGQMTVFAGLISLALATIWALLMWEIEPNKEMADYRGDKAR